MKNGFLCAWLECTQLTALLSALFLTISTAQLYSYAGAGISSGDSLSLSEAGSKQDSLYDSTGIRDLWPDSNLYQSVFFPFKNDPFTEKCREGEDAFLYCLRRSSRWAIQEAGFPGWPNHLRRSSNYREIKMVSPYHEASKWSPYATSGLIVEEYYQYLAPLETYDSKGLWKPIMPLDTPSAELHWERGALGLNFFQLELKRMLTSRSYLSFDFLAAVADSFPNYFYAAQTHQPYLSGWIFLGNLYNPIDRDSSSLVIEGNGPKIEVNHIRPRLGYWWKRDQVIEVYLDVYSNKTSLASPVGLQNDSLQRNIPSLFTNSAYGLFASGTLGPGNYQAQVRLEQNEDDYANRDSLLRIQSRAVATQSARASYQLPTFMGPASLSLEYSNRLLSGHFWIDPNVHFALSEGWEDQQRILLHKAVQDSFIEVGLWADYQRHSFLNSKVMQGGGVGIGAKWNPFKVFDLSAAVHSTVEFPNFELLFENNLYRNHVSNPSLEKERENWAEGEVKFYLGPLRLGNGWSYTFVQDPILNAVLPEANVCTRLNEGAYRGLSNVCLISESFPDSLALRYTNYDSEQRVFTSGLVGLSLGNWSLQIEQHFLLNSLVKDARLEKSLKNYSLPDSYAQGSLIWKRLLIRDRLGLVLAWDWNWYATRYAWSSLGNGYSQVSKLDEYIALDFKAQMEIKTFTLYFKTMNMNHDRYALDPGYHPPGVNFRFGVDWTFLN